MATDQEDKEDTDAQDPPKKSGKLKLIIGLVVGVLLMGGASVAGAVVGAKFLAAPEAALEEDATPEEPAESEAIVTLAFSPIVVDLRGVDGVVHHLKVSVAAELASQVAKEEVENFLPRGREAAITYLRSLAYEQATAVDHFETIKRTLGERIQKAIGEKRINAIRVTDFVAQ